MNEIMKFVVLVITAQASLASVVPMESSGEVLGAARSLTGTDYITTSNITELANWCVDKGCCQKENGATGHCSINDGATVTVYANACR